MWTCKKSAIVTLETYIQGEEIWHHIWLRNTAHGTLLSLTLIQESSHTDKRYWTIYAVVYWCWQYQLLGLPYIGTAFTNLTSIFPVSLSTFTFSLWLPQSFLDVKHEYSHHNHCLVFCVKYTSPSRIAFVPHTKDWYIKRIILTVRNNIYSHQGYRSKCIVQSKWTITFWISLIRFA
jgi:hypothetical protein